VKNIFAPSIVTRTLLALASASILVLVALLTINYIIFELTESEDLDENLEDFVMAISKQMVSITDEAQAAKVVEVIARTANDLDDEIKLYAKLSTEQNKVLYSAPELATVPIYPLDQVRYLNESGLSVITIHQGKWLLTYGRSKFHYSTALFLEDLVDHAVHILLALPFFMLPTWLAIRHGVKPIQQLNQHITQRNENDLSPITLPIKEKELKPVITSINQLLRQMSEKIAQEKAFVHDAAHELQTPLAGLVTQAHVMAKTTDPADKKSALSAMEDSIERVSHLIRQFLQFERLTHIQTQAWETTDVVELVRDSLASHINIANTTDTVISLEAPDHYMVSTVPHILLSIVNNLMSNALKYTGKNSQVLVTLTVEAEQWQLSVADDGDGIPEAEWPYIFARFYRAKVQLIEGTGLGLAIVKQASEALNGRVSIEHGIGGKGCCFSVYFPMR